MGERERRFNRLQVILLGGGRMRYIALFALIFSVGCVPVSLIVPMPAEPPRVSPRMLCTNLRATISDDHGRPRKAMITSNSVETIQLGYEYGSHEQLMIADFYPLDSNNRVGTTSRRFRVEWGQSNWDSGNHLWELIPDGWSVNSSGTCSRR